MMKHGCIGRPHMSHFCSFCTCHANGWCEGAVEGGLGQMAWTWTLAPPLTTWLWPGNPSPRCCGSLVSETEILWSASGMAWRIEWTRTGWCQSLGGTDFCHLPEPQGLGPGCHRLECALRDGCMCVRSQLWGNTERTLTTWFFVPGRSCCSVVKLCPALLTPWTAARQASLSFTISQSLLKLMSIELMMSSNHLVLCRPLLLLPSIFPSIRIFFNESDLRISWSKYASASAPVLPMNFQGWFPLGLTGLISVQSREEGEKARNLDHIERNPLFLSVKQFLWHWIKKETPLFSFLIMVEHRFICKTVVFVTVNSFTSPTYFFPFWICFLFSWT